MTDKELSMTAKEYFSQFRKIDKLILRLKTTRANLRSSLDLQSVNLTPDKVQTSGTKDQIGETVAKIADLESELSKRIDELVNLKAKTFQLINRLPDLDQQNVLVGRYIDRKEWDEIAAELGYSEPWIYKIHGKALISFGYLYSKV